jgi:3-dehydroquinate dehydratase
MATYKGTSSEKLIRQTYKNIKLLEVNTLDITIKKMNEKMESDFQLIDFSNLKDASPEVIGGMCLMGFGFVSRSLNSYFSGNQTYEAAKKQCEIFIDCLKNGFLK